MTTSDNALAKIQINDNGSTKTLAVGYVDTDVRTWTYTGTVAEGEHNVTYAYKKVDWETAEVTHTYTAEIKTESAEPEIRCSGKVNSPVPADEKAVFTVTTDAKASKIQFVLENGDTITLASGYEDIEGVRTWVYSKDFASGLYNISVMAKYGREWIDTETLLSFEVL